MRNPPDDAATGNSGRLGLPVLLVLLMSLLAPSAYAQGLFEQAMEEPEESAGASLPASLSLSGMIRTDLYVGKVPDDGEAELKSAYSEFALKGQATTGSFGAGVAEFRLRMPFDAQGADAQVDLREAYVDAYLGPFDIRFGKQILVWGRADAINPTNNLTPVDMRVRSPNEDDRRVGNLALRVTGFWAPLRVEAVWIPAWKEALLPEFPFPEAVTLSGWDRPDANLRNGIWAGRVHLELPSFEGSLSALTGVAPFPGLHLNSLSIVDFTPAVDVSFHPYRHLVLGGDFSTKVSDWFGMRGEAAYKRPLEDGAPDYEPMAELHWVLGIDREFGDVMVIIQYVGKWVEDWSLLPETGLSLSGGTPDVAELMASGLTPEEAAGVELRRKNRMIHGQNEEFQHGAMSRVQWKLLHETLRLELVGLWYVTTGDWMVRPSLSFDLADALVLSLGGEVFGGPDTTLYGNVDELMSAGFAELKFSF